MNTALTIVDREGKHGDARGPVTVTKQEHD